MTSRERVLLAIAHKETDRIPIHDSPWGTTEERWHREGMPAGQSSTSYFGFEFRGYWCDNSFQLGHQVIEETEEYTIFVDANGATRKNFRGRTTTPELIDFTVKTRALWEEYKPRRAWNESRVNWEQARKSFEDARAGGFFYHCSFGPGFTQICNIVGPERLLVAMVEDPEWAHDMFMTDARLCAAIAEEMMAKGIDFDAGWIFDDLGYKHKGFFSPAMYRELLMPAHKLIIDCFKSRGKPMILHCCGYAHEFVPLIIEAGFDCLQPLEVKAGNDLVLLKKQYGDRLAFMGGIDVRAMADPDPSVIEREIASKIPIAKEGGGYIFHSDHSVPDNVSFEQYCRVMELVAKYGRF
jgi:uroporphyrinogen decarboxylase